MTTDWRPNTLSPLPPTMWWLRISGSLLIGKFQPTSLYLQEILPVVALLSFLFSLSSTRKRVTTIDLLSTASPFSGLCVHICFPSHRACVCGAVCVGHIGTLPVPAGAVTISAWTDLAESRPSYQTNEKKDVCLNKDFLAMWSGWATGILPSLSLSLSLCVCVCVCVSEESREQRASLLHYFFLLSFLLCSYA